MGRRAQPAPIIWSNRMSDTGAIRIRSRRRWRISSWPAEKGISDSSAVPSTTDAPSGTWRPVASRMVHCLSVIGLRFLPDWLTLFQEGAEPFRRVLGRHQLVAVYPLGTGQPLAPIAFGGPHRPARAPQRGGAKAPQAGQQRLGDLRQLRLRGDDRYQPQLAGARRGHDLPRQHQLADRPHPEPRRQYGHGDRREDAERDLGKTEARRVSREHEVAEPDQLAA